MLFKKKKTCIRALFKWFGQVDHKHIFINILVN